MQAAEGAVGAYIAVLSHLGWKSCSYDTVQTDGLDDHGGLVLLHLDRICPDVVTKLAERRLDDIDAAAST